MHAGAGDDRRRYRFPPRLRVRKRDEFLRVRRAGSSVRDGVLKIGWCANETGESRLGLAVSRRLGNAVTRNRIKRVIREAFRIDRMGYPAGLDFVVIPVDPRRAARLDEVRRSLRRLTRRIRDRIEEACATEEAGS